MSCGRIRLLKHNPDLSDSEFRQWLLDREATLARSLTELKPIAVKMQKKWVHNQEKHLRNILDEVRDALEAFKAPQQL
jgi:hypothetical protein